MNRKKLLLIVNLNAGKGSVTRQLGEIIDCFIKADYDVNIYTTQAVADATRKIIEEGIDYDRIVCSGGDGTLNEVVRGMMHYPVEKRIPIGYIPSGTTNDFANSLLISKNMSEAAQCAATGSNYLVDVGMFNEQSFLYVAAFGAFTEVSYSTPQEIKNNLGRIAYLLEGIKSLANIKSYHLNVGCEDETFEGDFIYGQISNSTSVGGFQTMSPETIELNDGLFEMLLIYKPNNPLDLQNIIAALLMQDINSGWLVYRKVKKVSISSDNPIRWTLDGEYGGSVEKAVIENITQSIPLIVGKEDSNEII